MKKGFKLVAVLLSATLMLSSCIGSFSLTNKIKSWNEGLGDKFVNEIVFFAMHIIPVYPISLFIDGVVLNSIEFWTGNQVVSNDNNSTKIVKNSKGEDVAITATAEGYTVSNGTEEVNFIFNEADNSWSVASNGEVMLNSEVYASAEGARNGVATIINGVNNGKFVVYNVKIFLSFFFSLFVW